MNTYDDYTDVPELFPCLSEILAKLLNRAMSDRRNKQATVLGGLSAYVLLIQEGQVARSLEAMAELELMCTVSVTSHNDGENRMR